MTSIEDKDSNFLKESINKYHNLFRMNIEEHPVSTLNFTIRQSYLLALNEASKHQIINRKKTKMMLQLYENIFIPDRLPLKDNVAIDWGKIRRKYKVNLGQGRKKVSLKYLLILDILLLTGKMEVEGFTGKWMLNLQNDLIEKVRKKLKLTKKEVGFLCGLFKALEDEATEEAKKIVKLHFSNEKYAIIQYFYQQRVESIYTNSKEEKKIAVLATMSAGKSTVINTLLGEELLPSRNQACTNNIVEIYQNNALNRYIGYSIDKGRSWDYQTNVTSEILNKWNETGNNHIAIEGSFTLGEKSTNKVVLVDTPGPNNSSSEEHQHMTLERMKQLDYEIILYILNATQLASDDDRDFLLKVKKLNKPIVFILNKIDTYDLEGDDSIESALVDTDNYLKEIGFNNPKIVPFSAYATLLFLKGIRGNPLSRKELKDFYNYYEMFSEKEYNMKYYIKGAEGIETLEYKNTLQKYQKEVNVDKKTFSPEEIKEKLENTGFYYLLHILTIG